MKREFVFVAVLLMCAYALYGGVYALADSTAQPSAVTGGTHRAQSTATAHHAAGTAHHAAGTATSDTPLNFTEVSSAVGLNYTYESGTVRSANRMISDAGVYAGDYNRNGRTDLLAIGGNRPVLFNNTGNGFERSGVLSGIDRDVRGALFFDYNHDGWEDLLLLANGKPPLLLGNENGSYERADAGFDAPLDKPLGATTADYNNDGCLDLFVYQYGNWSAENPRGIENYSTPTNDDNGNPDRLYLGNCSKFKRTNATSIRGNQWSLAAASTDLTGDGRPDIYVAHDFNHDVLYRNQGNGTFDQVILPNRTNRNGMSTELADINHDGRLDVFVTNIYYPDWAAKRLNSVLTRKANGNNLLINHGNGTFTERAAAYNLSRGGWGWAAVIADLNNDGHRDVFHATRKMPFRQRDARFSKNQLERLRDRGFYSAPAVWVNEKGAYRNVSALVQGFHRANGRGVARLDYDRDGDLDLVVATTDGLEVYRNNANDADAVQVAVENAVGAPALGADVYVTTNDTTQWRRVHSRTDFLSEDSRVVHVGVGSATRANVRVSWPDGTQRTFEGVHTGERVTVAPTGSIQTMRFENASA